LAPKRYQNAPVSTTQKTTHTVATAPAYPILMFHALLWTTT
jgi:hypothetical protein